MHSKGMPINRSHRPFFGPLSNQPNSGAGGAQEYSVFVGDLSPEVTEYMLVVCAITANCRALCEDVATKTEKTKLRS
jgi:hypothetical protein